MNTYCSFDTLNIKNKWNSLIQLICLKSFTPIYYVDIHIFHTSVISYLWNSLVMNFFFYFDWNTCVTRLPLHICMWMLPLIMLYVRLAFVLKSKKWANQFVKMEDKNCYGEMKTILAEERERMLLSLSRSLTFDIIKNYCILFQGTFHGIFTDRARLRRLQSNKKCCNEFTAQIAIKSFYD